MNKHFGKLRLSARKKGFTIIELIVVIAIIAVLASIVLVNVTGYIQKARQAAAKASLSQLPALAVQWYEEYGSFYFLPGTESGCTFGSCSFTHHPLYGLKIKNEIEKYSGFYMGYRDGSTEFGGSAGDSPCLNGWVADVSDSSGLVLCVDSSGAKKTTGTSSDNYNACSCL